MRKLIKERMENQVVNFVGLNKVVLGNQRLDGDGWVCFDNWLDDLCYDVFVKLPMILSEHWH